VFLSFNYMVCSRAFRTLQTTTEAIERSMGVSMCKTKQFVATASTHASSPYGACADMTSSTKPEVHSVSLHFKQRTERRETCSANVVKLHVRFVAEIMLANRRTDKPSADRHNACGAHQNSSGRN